MKREFTCKAYLTEFATVGPDAIFTKDQTDANAASVLNALAFYVPWRDNGEGPGGWTEVGLVTMTIEFHDPNDMVKNKVRSLRKKKEAVLAKAQLEANDIEEDIQRLLAITYEPAVVG